MPSSSLPAKPVAGRRALVASALALAVGASLAPAHAAEPLKIGLVTALSGQSALAGEAISRGAQVAIDEINAKGGLLGGVRRRQRRAHGKGEGRSDEGAAAGDGLRGQGGRGHVGAPWKLAGGRPRVRRSMQGPCQM